MSRNSKRLAMTILISVALVLAVTALGFVRYMSPTDWGQIVTSPRDICAAIVAYRQLLHVTSEPDQRKLWNYEVVLGSAPIGDIHVVYVPRIRVDTTRKNTRYPGAHIRVSSGIETHVIIDADTFRVRRSYFSD